MLDLSEPPPAMLLRIGLLSLAISVIPICQGFHFDQPMFVNSSLSNSTGWYFGELRSRSKRETTYSATPISIEMAVGYFDLNEIVPQNGELLIFDSSIIPEEYMNRICANALSMKACIVIRDSGYKSLRCPYLHHIESCSPDRPFLEIVNNPNFHDLYLPDRLRYPNEGTPVVVELNPLIPTLALSPISNACPGCRVTNDIACGLMERDYTQIELVTACAGKEIIRPPRGYEIVLDSATVSEDQLNALCSNAVYLEACITISESQFKSLRCPRLEFLVSCRPERPAITIVNNPAFERLQIPEQVRFHPGGIPLRLEKNPMIEKDDMEVLKSLCPNCIIIPSNANTMDHNYQQWFGNVRIEPQEGSMLVFDSSAISERDMNKIFENVVYMKACLIISNSDYTNFRAPNLRHIESCAPDRPAVMLFNNPNLRNFFIPPDAIFVQSENAQLVVEINPLLPSYTLSALGELCPGCDVGRDIGCGSWNRPVTGAELVRACAGAAVIKPAPGIILQVNSSEVSEPELNELCSNVVYMKICITIYKSQFRSLRCPRLQMLESCEQGRPAIDLIDNPYLIDFYIPPNVVMDVGAIRIEINPQLPTRTLQGLEQAYPELTLTSDIVCGIGTRPYTLQEFIAACAGKPIIRPPPGGIIDLDATFMSEYDLNAICSEAVYMEVCITIARSNFQHLHCPKLQVLRSCSPDRPAIMVVDNPLFVSIIIPPVVVLSPYGIPIYFRNNPRLQKDPLKALEERYPNCIVIVEEEYVHVPDLQLWIGSPVLPPQSGNQTSPNSRNTTPTPENPWQPGAPGIPERPWTPGPSAIPGDLFRPGPGPIPGAPWRPAPGPIPEDPRVPAPNSIPGGPWRPGPGPIPGAPWKPDPNEVVGDRERPGPNPNPGDSLRPGPGPIPGAPWRPAPGPIPEDPQVPRPDPTREGIWRPGSTANPGAPWKPGPGPIPNDPRVPGPNPNPGDSLRPGPNPNPGGSWSTGPGPNPAAPWKPGPNGNVADKEKPSPGPNPGDSWRPGPGSIPNDPRVPGPNPNPGGPWRPGPGPIPTDPRVPGPNPNPGGSWSPGPGPNPGAPRKPGPDENVADKEKPSPGPNPGDSLRPGPGPIPNDPRVPGSNPSPGGPWRPGPDPSPGNQWGQTGPVGKPLVLDAYEIDEFVMNGLLAEVVYLKACIIVVNSNYTKLRIPRLRQLEPCEQNRPAIILFNNPFLVEFYMPEEVLYPADGVPMIVQLNPRLPPESLGQQQQHCPKCRVTDDVGCGLGFKEYTQKELIDACAGKAVIKPAPGFIIDVYSDYLTQSQINALCKDAIYMEICITIRKSSIKSLRCPKLRVLKPCQPGRAAIEIVENDFFEDLLIPSTVQYDPSDTPLHIELNPALPATILFSLQLLCPHCRLTNDIACGLSRKRYSAKELVRACAGTQIIRPVPGYMMVIDSREITEAEINALCSEAVYMEICLVISQSNIKSLKCPKLRTLKPCRPDEPAIKIVDNPVFETLELSEFLIYPTTGTPVQIENNPKLPEKMLRPIQDRCRNCITGTTEELLTETTARDYYGRRRIEPPPGKLLILHSSRLPEQVMNSICENAVYMKVCIIITNSKYKSLRCPNLQELVPCRPDRPALKVFKNLFLVDVYIPPTCSYPSTGVPIIMEINPLLPPDVMKAYQTRCPQCEVTPDIACGVDSAEMSVADIIINCANKAIIRPAPGSRIELDASQLTQKQLDDLCAKAIYMEICLNITKTQLKSLRCPMLQMLVPCETGRPAITIVNNPQFDNLYIPADCIFPPTGVTMYVELNPMIPTPVLQQLQQACPQCQLLEDIGCGLGRGHRSVNEILQACVGKKIIRPATGFVIEIDSLVATEDQINKICAAATYMEICIKMTRSNIQALRCPNLQVLKSCKPDTSAIIIEENQLFREFVIPPTVVLQEGSVPMIIINNPMLPKDALDSVRKICPKCLLTATVEVVTPEAARQWFGRERIEPPPGVSLVFDSSVLSQDDMNQICKNAVYMKACVVITNSTYTSFTCPYLKKLESCSPGRPAIALFNNIFLHKFYLPPDCEIPVERMPLIIEVNPLLDPEVLQAMAARCPQCQVTLDIACGLGGRQYSTEELVAACMGKAVIKPAPGYALYLDASRISEVEMNAICSKAIYIEACITIEKSNYKSLHCPVLKRLVSCDQTRPAIVMTENPHLGHFFMPLDVELPHQELPLYIKLNPLLPTPYLLQLQAKCPHCHIAYDIACGMAGQWTNIKQLTSACVGKKIIRPESGNMIVLDASVVTEDEINAVCANAQYMEVCIRIHQSGFQSLRCPKLEVLKPCRPDLPAISIINNPQFREFALPNNFTAPSEGTPVTIRANPGISSRQLHPIRLRCPNCIAHEMNEEVVTIRDAQRYYGRQRIVPSAGKALVFDASVLPEEVMNQICAEARYMEACIIIANSDYSELRCPHLQRIKSCRPDRPAIRLFNNPQLSVFDVPATLTFEYYDTPMIADLNPLLDAQRLVELQRICPQCRITADILCGLDYTRKYSPGEIAEACAGKAVIKPAPGEMLLFDSSVVTEPQMNAMCAKAIYMEVCITIKKSSFQRLVFPMLQYIKPCQEGRSAIDIMDNHEFNFFYLAPGCTFMTTSAPMHFEMNPRLPTKLLEEIGSACPTCNTASDIACGLGNGQFTFDEFINACDGKAVIKPGSKQILVPDSNYVTEKQMNRLCSNAVYMEICINITNSKYMKLSCPKLQDLVSCQPGRPALTIENNSDFTELMLPMLTNFPRDGTGVVIRNNPKLNPLNLQRLRTLCPMCVSLS